MACPSTSLPRRIAGRPGAPGTIGVGYNTIRFDDEVTRHLFWRNLIDPYGREWQNGCGRWDLLDVVRTAPMRCGPTASSVAQKGRRPPSFKLEHLTAANGLVHEAAHDALSDVRATIALARLVRDHQPRLFDFLPGAAQEGPRGGTSWPAVPRHAHGRFCMSRACSPPNGVAWR
jgi:exodeoxyribonuclease-1